MNHVYVTAAEAREVYAEQHDLPIDSPLVPQFPPGCKAHADYATELRAALAEFIRTDTLMLDMDML